MVVRDLLEQIPADTQRTVQEAVKRHKERIREAIRVDLRFKSQWKDPESGRTLGSQCPVRVDLGYPKAFGHRQLDPQFELAARLQMLRPALLEHVLTGEFLLTQLPALHPWLQPPVEHAQGVADLEAGTAYARRLLEMAQTRDFDLVRVLLEVHEDILGVYEYPSFEHTSNYQQGPASKRVAPLEDVNATIQLYWAVIGLVAACLGVSVEALTAVVLAHELAHYYTHLGYDRDGCRWSCQDFQHSDLRLKEGLAQFYSAQCAIRLDGQIPGMQQAYEKLLEKQSGPYLCHEPWLKIKSPEAIGATLARVRKDGPAGYEGFSNQLPVAHDPSMLILD